jgi:hypothetical protein
MGASKVEAPISFISEVGNEDHPKLEEILIPGSYTFNIL